MVFVCRLLLPCCLEHWRSSFLQCWSSFAIPGEKLTQVVNLKPGIDMVGGTSLVYEIKKPEGVRLTGKLASDVAEALKKRVDPNGVRNLVWRPQGDIRLEIQMPLSPDAKNASEQRRQVREQMIAADDALKATNVSADAVIDAIEGKNGKTQADLFAWPATAKPGRNCSTISRICGIAFRPPTPPRTPTPRRLCGSNLNRSPSQIGQRRRASLADRRNQSDARSAGRVAQFNGFKPDADPRRQEDRR